MIQDLSAVVVAYGATEDLAECLTSLAACCPVLVVDNSSDVHVREVALSSGCEYDDAGENLGFAAGVNRGIRRLPLNHDVLLVNPDAVVSLRAVETLVAGSAAPGVAAVAPVLLNPAGEAQRVQWPFPSPARAWRQALTGGDGGAEGARFLVGAVLLLTRRALNDVGLFDERFFLYAEETDWQRRAAARGWQLVLCTKAQAVHVGAGTSPDEGRREALFHAGTETYVRKWFGRSGWQSFRAASVARELIRLLSGRGAPGARRRLRLFLEGPRRAAGLNR